RWCAFDSIGTNTGAAGGCADVAYHRPGRRAGLEQRSRQSGNRRPAARALLGTSRNTVHEVVQVMSSHGPLRVGIGGPVGSGKTALTERLCKLMARVYNVAAITNDIYTKEDAEFLTRHNALAPERIMGVETGGCPHTAIREDASINLAAV